MRTALADALRCHQNGDLVSAERLYRRVLAGAPRHAGCLHLLGLLCHQTGRLDAAERYLRKAVGVEGTVAVFHLSLGNVLLQRGREREAGACYRRVLALDPGNSDACFNLAGVCARLGEVEEAIGLYRRVRPDYPGVWAALGRLYRQCGRFEAAADCFRHALLADPQGLDACNDLGNALNQLGRWDEAISCFRRGIEAHPASADLRNNLGNALKEVGAEAEAVAGYREAVALNPEHGIAWFNLGNMLRRRGEADEAILCFRSAIRVAPGLVDAYVNLGGLLADRKRLDEAVDCYDRALAVAPGLVDAHFNRALALLARGDLAEGWRAFEWRWKLPPMAAANRYDDARRWRGEAARGKTLLVHAEQGFGDTLQFCRYAPLIAERGVRVVLSVPPPLARLMRGVAGVAEVVAEDDGFVGFDLHCPMMSLPFVMGTDVATIPARVPYLVADAARVETWRGRLDGVGGVRVGLVWAGSSRSHDPALAEVDRRRSLHPELLRPLTAVPGVRLFSLQKDGSGAPDDFGLRDFMAEMGDFADTAALIANLDLVISVDTAVAHLAGGLGKPVWLLDRFDSCWRWLTGRRDSPWYPSLRLYRQETPGDWGSVVAEVAGDLRRLAGSGTA